MEKFITIIIDSILISCFVILTLNSIHKKMFDKRLGNIRLYSAIMESDSINFEDKGVLFSVKIVDSTHNGIDYGSPYETRGVYVNDELVCRVHKLEHLFIKSRVIEYTKNRPVTEIDKIISKAYKASKKGYNQYFNDKYESEKKLKSFYNI